ncbi:hypothetical protein CDCA_CDCA04G1250 [Cyanidium caldarium]|uniref:Uncharacterized protein n=1 Tax=Cyanidium caldarium TaxID=2771 RepID=A0AAV9IT03_CYACA|nr:hypothetical protein CDCA_CDCA04G1250 [Cyanidium caldarium]|eukprot:ctg_172.g102
MAHASTGEPSVGDGSSGRLAGGDPAAGAELRTQLRTRLYELCDKIIRAHADLLRFLQVHCGSSQETKVDGRPVLHAAASSRPTAATAVAADAVSDLQLEVAGRELQDAVASLEALLSDVRKLLVVQEQLQRLIPEAVTTLSERDRSSPAGQGGAGDQKTAASRRQPESEELRRVMDFVKRQLA